MTLSISVETSRVLFGMGVAKCSSSDYFNLILKHARYLMIKKLIK